MDSDAHPPGWYVVVPLKGLAYAKSRLALPPRLRAEAARAMALDTVAAAGGCPLVAGVVVVTDVAAEDFRRVGARVVADTPRAGLNAALRYAAEAVSYGVPGRTGVPGDPGGRGGIAALTADLPALSPEELAIVLRAVPFAGSAVVADVAGGGSTLLAAAAGATLRPEFGRDSHRRHLDAGARDLTAISGPGLRRDVDTLEDLRAAVALGVGRHTGALLPDLPGFADD